MKKGFTLIELLAVIVILAIIALIATPIILGIINDARDSANERSVELYITAVEQAIVRKNFDGEFNPTQCTIENSAVTCDGQELNVEVNGEKPTTGTIVLEKGRVKTGTTLNFSGFTATINADNKVEIGDAVAVTPTPEEEKPCTRQTDADGFDTVTCTIGGNTESFYVMNSYLTDVPSDKIVMMTKYNIDPTTYRQSQSAGTIAFSNTNYWSSETTSPVDVYNGDNNIKPIVDQYVSYLNSNGLSNVTGKLLSYEQAIALGCSGDNYSCSSAPSWVYSTDYWTGSASIDSIYVWYVWVVDSPGPYSFVLSANYEYDIKIGVRPVITISTSDVQQNNN